MDRGKKEFEVNSTPTVFVNDRRMQPGASAEEIGAVIDSLL
jgi:protein-disulfide isomerase